MIELDASRFHHLTVFLALAEGSLSIHRWNRTNERVTIAVKGAVHGDMGKEFDDFIAMLDSIGLRISRAKLVEVKTCWVAHGQLGQDDERLEKLLHEFRDRLYDELKASKFIVLKSGEQALYEPQVPLFGTLVALRFPSAAFEIAEAGKCLALERPTASAFHAMRSIEIGIRAIARCLGISDPIKDADRNWAVMLRKVKDETNRRNSATSPAWANSSDRQFFEEVYASLDAVRNPWRNATMHVENVYTEDEGTMIFNAVKGFMMKLATRMDDNGVPLA